jgi:hypothetical protein
MMCGTPQDDASPLHAAAAIEELAVAQTLLEFKADPNFKNEARGPPFPTRSAAIACA